MLLSTSPNDPVFYLHQCNTDRAWETWMQQNGRVYLPVQSESSLLLGHRIDDAMMSLLSDPMTPRQVLNLTHLYTYDKLVI
jgi:tyrosinase